MTTDAVGGVWTFSLDMAAGLAAVGVETVLVVQGPPPSDAKVARAEAIPGLRLVQTGLDLEWQDRRGVDVPDTKAALLRVARRVNPQIVHVNGFREASFRWGVPTVVTAHSDIRSWWRAMHNQEPPAEWQAYEAGVRAGLKAADAVAVPTRSFRFRLEQLYGPMERARVIANGRDIKTDPSRVRRPFVLAAGRAWDEGKNLKALESVALRLPWPVVVAGPAPERGRAAKVTYMGELAPDVLLELMAEAEIFCAPARYEPFGLAILEAAAAGAALVLGDIATLRETWRDAAAFVPPNDPDRLQQMLVDLMGDTVRRQRLQRAARARAAHFSRDRMVKAYLELYGELLERRVASPAVVAA